MKWRSIGALLLVGCLFLGGCDNDSDDPVKNESSKETHAINDDDYSALLPFNVSDARYIHADMKTSLLDTMAISDGLMQLSKQHFSPKSYAYREAQFLDYNTLKGTLLVRESDENPKGLNPSAESEFAATIGKTALTLKAPVLLVDLYELDWYQNEELSGLSIAMVVSSQSTDPKTNQVATITDAAMENYENVYGQRVIEYLRDTYPQVKNLPIYLTIYDIAGDQEGVPGAFKREAYFESNTASFSRIREQWAIVPTETSNNLDETINTAFLNYKKVLDDLDLGEDTSIIGTGKFQDGSLSSLKINVNAHAKTGSEMNAIVQLLNENLSLFTSTSYRITVDISCDDIHYAVIERASGSSKTNTIYL